MEVCPDKFTKNDINKIVSDLNVSIINDYGPKKSYKIYEIDTTNNKYILPLHWANKNLSIDICPEFKNLERLEVGRFLALPRPVQQKCIIACSKEYNKPWGGGIINIGTGGGKCHAIDTEIMMSDGTIKKVQDIKVGESLMGDDSKKRKVLSLVRGQDEMYEIIPIKGDKYVVNKEHILCLKMSGYPCLTHNQQEKYYHIQYLKENKFMSKTFNYKKKEEVHQEALNFYNNIKYEQILEISVKNYLELSKNKIRLLKGYKVPVEFLEKKLPLDPYMIGFWLGDGSSDGPKITTQDTKVLFYFRRELRDLNLMISKSNGDEYSYNIISNRRPISTGRCNECNKKLIDHKKKYFFCSNNCSIKYKKGYFLKTLQEQNLIKNKHIPDIYKYNSRDNRLKLLAGLIDSDGHLSKGNGFEFVQKNEKVMDDVVYLCRSLGFSCYKAVKKTSWTYKGVKKHGTAFRITINGNGIEEIPTLCDRKKAKPRQQIKNVLVSGIKVKNIGVGNYYGFNIDGNRRYLLGDFTVTHNSVLSMMLFKEIKLKMLIVVHTTDLMEQWIKSLNFFLPDIQIGKIQGSVFDVEGKHIVIGMLQTISMKSNIKRDLFADFGISIYDEVQFLSAETFSKALLKSRTRYTFGLSATVERADGMEKVFKYHIGDIIFSDKNNSLKKQTSIIKPIFYKNKNLKEKIMYNGKPNLASMINDLVVDKARNKLIIDELLSLDQQRNVLVLSDRVDHLKYLQKCIGDLTSGLFIGGMKEQEKNISKGKKILFATYSIASVGFDHPILNTLVFATPRSNITQSIGRIYRKHHQIKPLIIDIVDTFSVFPYQFKKREKIYKTDIYTEEVDDCLF